MSTLVKSKSTGPQFHFGLSLFFKVILKKRGSNLNPLYTNGFFLLVSYNKLGMVLCTYLGVSGYFFFKKIVFFCLKIFFTCTKCVDPDEMQHYAAFHLSLHSLQKYSFRGFPNTKGYEILVLST